MYYNPFGKIYFGLAQELMDAGIFKNDDCDHNVPPKDLELKRCAKALLDKLKLIMENREYKRVWELAYIHGVNYNGPTFDKEFDDLKGVLL